MAHVVDAELEDACDAFLLQAAEDAALAQGHVHAAVAVGRLGELTGRGEHELALEREARHRALVEEDHLVLGQTEVVVPGHRVGGRGEG